MNPLPSAGETPLDSKLSAESAFFKLFAAGLIGWVVGAVALFGLSWVLSDRVTNTAEAVFWAIAHNWAGFLFGAAVLVAFGAKSGNSIGRAAIAYLLPVVLMAAIGVICVTIYPDRSLRDELLSSLPMVLTFYVISLFWIWARKSRNDSDNFLRAVIPTIIGSFVILGFITLPVFATDAFRYRNTFRLSVSKAEMQDGKFVADASLEVREPGNYSFVAPRYIFSAASESDSTEDGVITWGAAGEPNPDVPGVHPFQIVWTKALFLGETVEYDSYGRGIDLEVRNPDEGNKVIYYLSAPIPTN